MTCRIARQQPEPDQPMKHRWDPTSVKTVLPEDSPDGNERHERTCLQCGVTKATVIPPTGNPNDIWVEYQFKKDGPVSFERPDCVPVRPVELKEAKA